MKRIEDIKEFEDIDTYYGVLELVEEVFQDRVETHKHLLTANKEIERLHSIIKEVREYIEENVAVYAFSNKDLPHWEFNDDNVMELLEILDKEKQ